MNEDNFKFDLDAPVKRISDEKMLESLQRFYDDKSGKKPFTTTEYDNWPSRLCHSGTISERFGGWRKALKKIGIEKGVQPREYESEELMDNLEKIWRTLGYPPGKRKLSKLGYGISERPYINRWGSVKNACALLSRYKNGEITENDLLKGNNGKKRKSIPLKIRWDVLSRDNDKCVKCGCCPPEIKLEVDHIVPIAKGGDNSFENLQTLCNRCNQGKKDRLE